MQKKEKNRRGPSTRNRAKRTKAKLEKTLTKLPAKEEAQVVQPPLIYPSPAEIDLCPFNYRTWYDPQELESFSKQVKRMGMIISPVTVRRTADGRYQLVVGERRWRAATIAELKEIPCILRELTDIQVREMQLAENLQRENPHPFHEAQGIGNLQQDGFSIDKIVQRLGKTKAYILSRVKLLALIEPFQEVFLAGKINLREALQLAMIEGYYQQEIFDNYCKDWQKNKHFHISDLMGLANKYKCDLTNAPFDLKDKQLLPHVGACASCTYNTASLKSLFPETAKSSFCTNKACFDQKCSAYATLWLADIMTKYNPQVFLFYGQPSSRWERSVSELLTIKGVPALNYYEVETLELPCEPTAEDFTDECEGEDGADKSELDQEAFNEALQEYQQEVVEHQEKLLSGGYQKAILLSDGQIEEYVIDLEATNDQRKKPEKIEVTSKAVQAALKAGTATVPLLEAEIERMQSREVRSLELDKEKVQEQMHKDFSERFNEASRTLTLTTGDLAGARLLIYRGMDYSSKSQISGYLFPKEEDDNPEELFKLLSEMSEADFSFLIRAAMVGRSESKMPKQNEGYFLRQMAEQSGMDVAALDAAQGEKATKRQATQLEKTTVLQAKIKRLNNIPQ